MSGSEPASRLRPCELELLQQAIALSAESVGRGGRPFGAVVCDGRGQIVSEACAVTPTEPRDWTAHSEMRALRTASAKMTWDELSSATIFASGEPCPMCAAAIYWCNVHRLVLSVSEPRARFARTLRARGGHCDAFGRNIFPMRSRYRCAWTDRRGAGACGASAVLAGRTARRVGSLMTRSGKDFSALQRVGPIFHYFQTAPSKK